MGVGPNNAPISDHAIADQVARSGVPWNFVIPADAFTDPDGDALTFAATLVDGAALPEWLSFDPATGVLTGTPPTSLIASIDVKIVASDGQMQIVQDFRLMVAPGSVTEQLRSYLDVQAEILQHTEKVVLSQPYEGGATDYQYLKDFIRREAAAYYGVDESVFDTSSVESTTYLRDFVHKLVYFRESYSTYFDAFMGGSVVPLEMDVAALLRNGLWGACGEISWQLYQIYQALGYETRYVGYVNNTIATYDDGHVVVEVVDDATGERFVQDPTYNLVYVDIDGHLMDRQDMIREVADQQYIDTTYLLNGNIYTTYSINGTIHVGLDAANHEMLVRGIVMVPVEIRENDTLWKWSDMRRPDLPAITDISKLLDDIAVAKANGASFADFLSSLAGRYDVYGAIVKRSNGDPDHLLVLRQGDGTDMSVLWSSLDTVSGGLDAQWKAVLTGQSGAFDGVDYSASVALISWSGIEYSIYGDQNSVPSAPSLNYDLVNGGRITIEVPQAGLVTRIKSFTYGDIAQVADTHSLATGALVKTEHVFADATRFVQEIDTSDAVPWATAEHRYDASGRVVAERTVADDGTSVQIDFDRSGSFYWSRLEQRFDSAGQVSLNLITSDDGSNFQIDYDRAGTFAWSTIERRIDAAGGIIAQRFVNDDATSFQADYDSEGIYDWQRTELRFDVAGELVASRLVNDGGMSFQVDYDRAGALAWSRIEQRFDAAGGLIARRIVNDDATSFQADYDRQDIYNWDRTEFRFDAAGGLIAQRFVNDDGTSFQVDYDRADALAWSRIEQRFDAAGGLIARRIVNDDATSFQADYDRQGIYNWDRTEFRFDAAGGLIAQRFVNDDGTSFQVDYDRADALAWSSTEQRFDASGAMVARRIVNDDATSSQTDFDITNSFTWSRIEQGFDAAGQLVAHHTMNDDGGEYRMKVDAGNASDWLRWEQRIDPVLGIVFSHIVYDGGQEVDLAQPIALGGTAADFFGFLL